MNPYKDKDLKKFIESIPQEKANMLMHIQAKKMEKESDFWDALTKAQQEEIELGIEELERGETVSMEEILKA